MGYLRNRGSRQRPEWYIRFRDADGRWKQRHSHQATHEAARRYLAAVEARVSRGLVGIADPTPEERSRQTVTIKELCDRFVVEYGPPRIKDLARYRAKARTTFALRVVPVLGGMAAALVKAADVERLRDDMLRSGLAHATVTQTLAHVSKLFNWSRKVGALDCANPVSGIERPRATHSLDFLDKAEVGRLLAHVEQKAAASGARETARLLAPMVATAIYGGLRRGELYGLRWRDLDLDGGRLTVARSYRLLPKSGEVRHLPMHPDLARVLRTWRESCPATDEGLVFPVGTPGGTPGRFRMGGDKDSLGIADALAAAKCHLPADGHPWHMLRHTFAAQAVMSGISLYAVQRLMGHSTPQMTQRYAHLAPDFLASEVAKMAFARPAVAGVADLDEQRRKRVAGE